MRWFQSVLAVGFVSFAAVACGDDDEVGDTAAELCETSLAAACDRHVACSIEQNVTTEADRDQTLAACKTARRAAGTNCGRAYSVGSSYDQCLEEIPQQACSEVLDPQGAPPDACRGIIIYRP
jgi:hypothetical protein